ncbi:MAG: NAD-dependent epimerase/dehydratase family protein [Candidatus Pacebacteria bacterium]|nr:NAD-dependent epimerase/dehydratase family protein [Candidatus Paceibacterota bacterium]
MEYTNKTVLVTGAAGFLGSHVCDRLLEQGAHVIGVDSLITGRKENLSSALSRTTFTFIEADCSTSPRSYLPATVKPDVIFHLASPASPPIYQQFPIDTYLVNALGTHQLLQYLLTENRQGRFIFASTSEVYGDPKERPQKESYWGNVNPNGVRSCYDESKRFGEMVCGVHSRDFGLDVRIVRIFNTYGPRMSPLDGRVIPNFMMQALKNEPLTIYGDGTQTRSFCYVDDLIRGILLLGSTDSAKNETVNIGSPTEKTVNELAEMIQAATHATGEYVYKPLPSDDPTQRLPDISKAVSLLGWKLEIDFPTGLEKTLEYFKTQV